MRKSMEAVALEGVELETLTEGLEESGAGAAGPGAVGRTLFVSASASSSGSGSSLSPFARIRDALEAARPGDTIRVRAGTYRERIVLDKDSKVQAGTEKKPIKLLGEERNGVKPRILAVVSKSLVAVELPHWRIEGFELDVGGHKAHAVSFKGDTEQSSLARCDVHGGKSGAGISTSNGARGVTIEDNRIHDFHRDGDDSHGVVVQATSQRITIRGNHISNTSADAVQVLIEEKDPFETRARHVLIENNVLESTNENAVDIKSSFDVTVRRNTIRNFRSIGKRSGGDAVVVHYSAEKVLIEENDISETGRGISVGGVRDPDPKGFAGGPRNVRVLNNTLHEIRSERAKNAEASGIRVNKAEGVEIRGNTIKDTDGFAVRFGGEGTEGPSRKVVLEENKLLADKLVRLVSEAPGFKMDFNQYSPDGRFHGLGGRNLDLAEWRKRTGQDANSNLVDPEGDPS